MEQTKRRLRIGILSDSPFFVTGYATIARKVANILSERGHEVFYFGNGYMGQTLNPGTQFEDGLKLNFTVIGGGRANYFQDLLPIYTKQYKLDVLFVLLDTFMLYPWIVNMDLSPARTIFYYPSDGGGGMPLGCDGVLRFFNRAVAMAKFGQKQVKDMYNIDTGYIPHAIDTKLYYPLSDEKRAELKAKWGLTGKFVVGTVARNQGRKMLDRTFKAMALLAKENPNAVLLMHTDPDDQAQVFHMGAMIDRYKLQNRIVFSGMKFFKGFDYTQMNEVYNIMDVFLLTTSGEGFGIPIIEAMACEVPVLATDYTTTRELVIDNKAGLGIDLVGTEPGENPWVHENEIIDGTITGSWNVERGICSVKDCAKKLQMFYNYPNMRKELGKNGKIATDREYNWDVCGKQWCEELEKLGGQY